MLVNNDIGVGVGIDDASDNDDDRSKDSSRLENHEPGMSNHGDLTFAVAVGHLCRRFQLDSKTGRATWSSGERTQLWR